MGNNRYNFTMDPETVEILKSVPERQKSGYVCGAVKLRHRIEKSKKQPVEVEIEA